MTRLLNILAELGGWCALIVVGISPGLVYLMGLLVFTDRPITPAIGPSLIGSAVFCGAVYGGWYALERYRPAWLARLKGLFA